MQSAGRHYAETSFWLNNPTRWLSTIPQIRSLEEWIHRTRSWAYQDPSLLKMLNLISALESSVINAICVVQRPGGDLVFGNVGHTMDFEGMLDFLIWHLRQRAAREAAFFAGMSCLKQNYGRLNRLGPIHLTCDGWYSPSDSDSDELPDLIDPTMYQEYDEFGQYGSIEGLGIWN
ncbi:hypothetical protein B0H16DRAFT_1480843 [Mycena metata]|uniref:Uncharacterized protein n=1 Tax=Mycena metata TaxID=1033252 RepID=A0AAD7H1J9_9AGAR|nr:hypothetical protein B0H16DRAFT_1480843 [Mycena metata]